MDISHKHNVDRSRCKRDRLYIFDIYMNAYMYFIYIENVKKRKAAAIY